MQHFLNYFFCVGISYIVSEVHYFLGRHMARDVNGAHWTSWLRLCTALAVEGGKMELGMRLNVLATIVSFGFLAAVVLGMI
jgi:hypothetical protein